AIDLPESLDLTSTTLHQFGNELSAKIQASEPGVTLHQIERPRIRLIHAKARRRLEQYRQRARLSGPGIQTFGSIDYSYNAHNFHPLGLRLFETKIRTPVVLLQQIVEQTPRGKVYSSGAAAA